MQNKEAKVPVLRNRKLTAAQEVMKRIAHGQVVATQRTVVAVIGSEDDKTRVAGSLADVTRRILLLWANTDAKGDNYDNTLLKRSLLDRANTLRNVWVYRRLPPAQQTPRRRTCWWLASSVVARGGGDVPAVLRAS